MINGFCRKLACVLSNFKIIDFSRLLNAPDKRTDAEKIKHDFDKALDKYQRMAIIPQQSINKYRAAHSLDKGQ